MDRSATKERDLITRARNGDQSAQGVIFEEHRERLLRMVQMRLDRQLRSRIDASDIVQNAYVEVWKRLDQYMRDPKLPFFLWLRLVVGEQVINVHREHLGTEKRDAGREISVFSKAIPAASSVIIVEKLLEGNLTSPTKAAVRAELQFRMQEALNDLDPIDREVLSLRHFEQLKHAEAALVLGISEAAASKRYYHALDRLERVLATAPGGLESP